MIIFGKFQPFPKRLCYGRAVLSAIDEPYPGTTFARLVDIKRRRYGSTMQEIQDTYDKELKANHPDAIYSDIEIDIDNPMLVNAIRECKTVEEIQKILLLI